MSSASSIEETKGLCVIVLEFEDTLFPTTAIATERLSDFTDEGRETLRRVEMAVIMLLWVCLNLGEVTIVTTASMEIIEERMSHYFKRFKKFVHRHGIELVSASDFGERERADRTITCDAGAVSLLRVGPGNHAYFATRRLMFHNENVIAKSVRFCKKSSVRALERDIKWWTDNVPSLMSFPTCEEWRARTGRRTGYIRSKSFGGTVAGAYRAAEMWAKDKVHFERDAIVLLSGKN